MDNFKYLYIKYKNILWPLSSGLICALVGFFVIYPQVKEYIVTDGQIKDVNRRTNLLGEKAKDLSSLDDVSIKQDLTTVFTILPIDRDVPQAMITLQSLISQWGLALKSTAYSSSARLPGRNSFVLNISVTGPLAVVRNFFNGLAEIPGTFLVGSISVHFQKEGSVVDAEVPISVFYEPAPQGVTSLEQLVPKLDEKEESLLAELSKYALKTEVVSTATAVPIGKANPFE